VRREAKKTDVLDLSGGPERGIVVTVFVWQAFVSFHFIPPVRRIAVVSEWSDGILVRDARRRGNRF
jgi:hypothetical protein